MPRNYTVSSRKTELRKGVIQVEKEGTACTKAVVGGSLGVIRNYKKAGASKTEQGVEIQLEC